MRKEREKHVIERSMYSCINLENYGINEFDNKKRRNKKHGQNNKRRGMSVIRLPLKQTIQLFKPPFSLPQPYPPI